MAIFGNLSWEELVRTPIASTFSMESSEATLSGTVDSSVIDNTNGIVEVLGSSIAGGDGRINRLMPLAHPEYPWLFAESLQIEGIGFKEKAITSAPSFDVKPMKNYAKYKLYKYTIRFTTRPYSVLPDTKIKVNKYTVGDPWYIADTGVAVPTAGGFVAEPPGDRHAEEWLRYTDYEENCASDYITAQQGQFRFSRADGNAPDVLAVPGQIKMLQRKTTIKYRWSQVPYSYISSEYSWINQAQGSVNQFNWCKWNAGTLLFLGYTYKRYAPAHPYIIQNPEANTLGLSMDKLADIEFVFLHFDPGTPVAGTGPDSGFNNDNKSFIAAGHNLMPYGAMNRNRGWYYSTGGSFSPSYPPGDYAPLYPSFPFQLIFTDPDINR